MACIIERDDLAGDAAHRDLIRAEARLLRMEGRLSGEPAPRTLARVPDSFDVIER